MIRFPMSFVGAIARRIGRVGRTPLGLASIVLALSVASAGQDRPPPQPDATDEPSELTTSEQTVEVETPTRDQAIETRLERILVATERFTNPSVDVRDGVAFLSGRTADARYRDWAADLARRTEGVAAVVNDIDVTEPPIWTLEPAANEVRELWRQLVRAVPLIALGLTVLLLTLLVSRLATTATRRSLEERVESDLVLRVIERLVWLAVFVVGIYLFLRISGLTRIAVTLAGGTGLLGLILGFAFRDIAENFLASILLSVQRPFRLGDTIEVVGHIGVVQRVTMRGTVLMDFDGNHIQIANATVYKNTIKNLTANPKLRIGFTVGIGYDASISEAQQLAMDVLRGHSAVLADPEPLVLVEQLGSATINVRIYFWIDGHEHSMLKVRSSVMRLIVRAYEQAGISLPDEAREVIFPEPVPVRMLDREEPRPSPRPADRRAAASDRAEVTDAEGDLRSEVVDIQEQARSSRSPEEGADILQERAGPASR